MSNHNHMLKCVCENEGLWILGKKKIYEQNRVIIMRVCKPEYFIRKVW